MKTTQRSFSRRDFLETTAVASASTRITGIGDATVWGNIIYDGDVDDLTGAAYLALIIAEDGANVRRWFQIDLAGSILSRRDAGSTRCARPVSTSSPSHKA